MLLEERALPENKKVYCFFYQIHCCKYVHVHTIAACTSRVGGADVAGCGALKINKLLKTVAIAEIESEVPNKCQIQKQTAPSNQKQPVQFIRQYPSTVVCESIDARIACT